MDLVTGEQIEQMSMETIDREAGDHGFKPYEWAVVRRMVHASADFAILPLVKFNKEPISKGIEALKNGAPIITDSSMLKSGISKARLSTINNIYRDGNIFCNIADKEVGRLAKEHNLSRSIFNFRSLKDKVDGGIICIGNAPTALWEVIRLINEEGIKPALVFAMPVGFINVVETKNMIKEMDIPYILMDGRRGGTTFAVAAINAIAILAMKESKI
ncbi:MAG: precorrin-8X methylmutase [Desulfobacteraceae bacterium]|jgi:cobalt/nickel transport system ATP-binding protein/precorrin-8X/cobalt-precorrin-8 methylmutase